MCGDSHLCANEQTALRVRNTISLQLMHHPFLFHLLLGQGLATLGTHAKLGTMVYSGAHDLEQLKNNECEERERQMVTLNYQHFTKLKEKYCPCIVQNPHHLKFQKLKIHSFKN